MWHTRASASEPAGVKVAVVGSQTSAEASAAVGASSQPPTTRTRPSGRSVAVWPTRASASEPAGPNVPGRRVPDLRRGDGRRSRHPCPRRRGHGRRAAAWRCVRRVPRRASLVGLNAPVAGSQTSAEARKGRSLRAADDEDAAVGQERGRVVGACLGERARRGEGMACRRLPDLGRARAPVVAATAHDEDTSVGQERGGVEGPSPVERPRW